MALNNLGLGLLFTAKDAATGVMSKVRRGFSDTKDELGAFKKQSKEAFKAFGVGMAVFGAGVAGLAVLGSTIDEAREFGKAIALVGTEVDAAKFSQEDMRDITIDLAKQFGRMPKDEAEALYKAVALGADDAGKATSILTAANRLAVAGNSELKTTMDALGGSINAYGLSMGDADRVSDAFFIAMKSGNTTVQDLASSVGRVSAGAHSMGIGIEDILGSVSVMTNKGVQASEAVSYLHGALSNIVHPSSEAGAEAARLGIKFNAAAVRAQGFQKFLHSITDNAKFSKDTLNKLFTSVEGSQAMAMLAGDMGAVDAVMKRMRTETGATAKGFDIMAGTLSFQGDRFKALFSALKIRVGEFLEPLAARGLGILNKLMDTFTNLPGPVQGVIVHVALAVSGVVALVGAVTAGIAAFKIAAAAIGTFAGGALGTLATALIPAIALVGALTAGYFILQYAITNNIGGIGDTITRVWGQIKLGTEALIQLFSQGGFSGAVREQFLSGSNSAIQFAIQVWLAFTRVKNFLANVVAGFEASIAEMKPTFAAFGAALDKLLDAFGGLSKTAEENGAAFDSAGRSGRRTGQVLARLAELLVKGATAFVELAAAIVPVVAGIMNFVSSLGDAETLITVAKTALVGFATYMVASAVPALWSMASGGISAAAGIAKVLVQLIAANGLSIGGAFSAAASGLGSLVTGAAAALGPIGAVTAAITALYLAFDQFQKLSAAWNDEAGSDMWKKFKNDIGITSDAEYQKELGIHQGADFDKRQQQRMADAFENRPQATMSPATIPGAAPTPATSPAVASVQPPQASGIDQSAVQTVASQAASAAVSKVPAPNYSFTMQVNEEVLGRVTARASSSAAAASYGPASVSE
jgi:TP901 family phage tail tape measure protein